MAYKKRKYTQEEKTAYAKAQVDEAASLLQTGIQNMVSNDENYKKFLSFYSGFHQYSLCNTILIMIQSKGSATICANYKDWQKKGRFVKRGEKGLLVRVPTPKKFTVENDNGEQEERSAMFFKTGYVFDISQTDGEEVPTICHDLHGHVGDFDNLLSRLRKSTPCPISFVDKAVTGNAHGFYDVMTKSICIRSDLEQTQKIKTVIHEIAHSILHDKDKGVEKDADKVSGELQAESVAYIVCHALGLDTSEYSFGYVCSWAREQTPKKLEQHMTVIGKCAMQIISALET